MITNALGIIRQARAEKSLRITTSDKSDSQKGALKKGVEEPIRAYVKVNKKT
jgi:hypothetical protein